MGNDKARIADRSVALALLAHEEQTCLVANEGPAGEQTDELVSCTGGVFWGAVGESWPRNENGIPLFPWLQIVCSDLEEQLGPFSRYRLVTFFLDPQLDDDCFTSTEDGSAFVVRNYAEHDPLVPLSRPPELNGHPFHRVSWTKCRDYPSPGRYFGLLYDDLCEDLEIDAQEGRLPYHNHDGTKIGGWPTTVQTPQPYPSSWDLQVSPLENFMFGDSGIAFIGEIRNGWFLLFETH